MSCDMSIRVFNGRSNTDALVFGIKDVAGVRLYDFSEAGEDVTRMTLEFTAGGDSYVVDSDVSASAITWAAGSGEVVFSLGDQGLPVGSHEARLFIYSDTHPTGYLLDAGDGYTVLLDVRA